MRAPRQIEVLGLPLNAGSLDDLAEAIFAGARASKAGHVCIANVHMFTLAQHSTPLTEAINQASFVTSDGMPLVWALRRKGCKDAGRVAGLDLMDRLCTMAAAEGLPIYLYGGSEATLAKLKSKLASLYPNLRLAGAEAPPMLAEEPALDSTAAERIKASGAALVFVGLGCPKQENWMAVHAQAAGAMMIGVGAAFDFLAGSIRRAPRWMQRSGLEWIYRLACEPRRLFRRYLVSNSRFAYYLMSGKL